MSVRGLTVAGTFLRWWKQGEAFLPMTSSVGGVLPSDFECWGCDWGEFGRYSEDAVEFSVKIRCCYGGRDAGEDSNNTISRQYC